MLLRVILTVYGSQNGFPLLPVGCFTSRFPGTSFTFSLSFSLFFSLFPFFFFRVERDQFLRSLFYLLARAGCPQNRQSCQTPSAQPAWHSSLGASCLLGAKAPLACRLCKPGRGQCMPVMDMPWPSPDSRFFGLFRPSMLLICPAYDARPLPLRATVPANPGRPSCTNSSSHLKREPNTARSP